MNNRLSFGGNFWSQRSKHFQNYTTRNWLRACTGSSLTIFLQRSAGASESQCGVQESRQTTTKVPRQLGVACSLLRMRCPTTFPGCPIEALGHAIFRLTRDSMGLLRGLERLLDRTLRGYVTATIPSDGFPLLPSRPNRCLHYGSTAMARYPGRAMACQLIPPSSILKSSSYWRCTFRSWPSTTEGIPPYNRHSRAAKRPLAASLPATSRWVTGVA